MGVEQEPYYLGSILGPLIFGNSHFTGICDLAAGKNIFPPMNMPLSRASYFGCVKEAHRSVQVLLNFTESVVGLTLIILI